MKNKWILILLPLIIVALFFLFSKTTELLRQPSDTAVAEGAGLACLMIVLIILFFKLIKQK